MITETVLQLKKTSLIMVSIEKNSKQFKNFLKDLTATKLVNTYAKLCLNRKLRVSFIPKTSIRHHNKSYDYENNNKSSQKPGRQLKSATKCRSHVNHKLFSEIFIYCPLKVLSKPLATINVSIM